MERELLLLGLLRQHEMHGYELHSFIENAMSTCIDLKKPTAYLLLDQMTAAGWITVSEQRSGNRPPRKVYRLTTAGEAQFDRLLRANLASVVEVKFGGDVGLAFVDALPPAEAIDLLTQRRQMLVTQLQAAQQVPPHAGSLQILIDHQAHYLASELAWVDKVIAQLRVKMIG